MDIREEKVLDLIEKLNINYKRVEHKAIFTVKEGKTLPNIEGKGCKNLFLKSKNDYFLLILDEDKKANLDLISNDLKTSKLSFGSKESLNKFLGLKPGAVSPFGLINDSYNSVKVIIDENLEKSDLVSFHPNVNTSTLIISYIDFIKFLDWTGNIVYKTRVY